MERTVEIKPVFLLVTMAVHALISIFLTIRCSGGTGKPKGKSYPAMNVPTNIQRLSGGLMIVLLGLHITGVKTHFQPKIVHAIIQPLFFALSFAHISVSTSKAMITLGIGNTKVIKTVNVVMRIICGATLIAGVVGFYICLFVGVTR